MGRKASVLDQASDDYQAARTALQRQELALRDMCEQVAAERRGLPAGPVLATDYVFDEGPPDLTQNTSADFFQTRLSDLFAPGHDTLLIDHFMFGAQDKAGCPMCSMWADSYRGAVPHLARRLSFAVVAKTDIGTLRAWAAKRGWLGLRLLSSAQTRFNADFEMESEDGGSQFPGLSVFKKLPDGRVQHCYSQRAMYRGVEGEYRGLDIYTPLWNLLDLTPDGRGDFMPTNG